MFGYVGYVEPRVKGLVDQIVWTVVVSAEIDCEALLANFGCLVEKDFGENLRWKPGNWDLRVGLVPQLPELLLEESYLVL